MPTQKTLSSFQPIADTSSCKEFQSCNKKTFQALVARKKSVGPSRNPASVLPAILAVTSPHMTGATLPRIMAPNPPTDLNSVSTVDISSLQKVSTSVFSENFADSSWREEIRHFFAKFAYHATSRFGSNSATSSESSIR